jgi:hypothetical protein
MWFRPAMPMERDEPAPRRGVKLGVTLAAVLVALSSCNSELPAPVYPSPEDAPLEETELWQYFEEPSLGEEEEEVDEAWQDEIDEGWDEGEEDVDPPPDEPPPAE